MDTAQVKIEESWKNLLQDEFSKPYFSQIKQFLKTEKASGKSIYPKGSLIFNAFNTTPVDQVKVLILGQDPYHQPGQAMGLSFSVPKHVRTPPSLVNIYKELNADLGHPIPSHGDLTKWAQQGVLLLNAMLTVEKSNAGSHSKIGWQNFSDAVISRLSNHSKGVVFMLWGNFAKSKKPLIDHEKHLVLEAAHPSPLARNAYNGSRHFSQANEWLISKGKNPIDWVIE